MYKNASYREKFADLQPWVPDLIESVKKDLKQEHLKKDFHFIKKFFGSKNIHKVTKQEFTEAYQKAIQQDEKGEELAEFIAARWLIKHSDLYHFFEQRLSKIQFDFTLLEELNPMEAKDLIVASTNVFGAVSTYLFAVLNSVVFPKESFVYLKQQAEQQHQWQEQDQQSHPSLDGLNGEELRKTFEKEIARLTDKYEKKLSGLQKKYCTDVESFKKQIAQLQRKLQEKAVL
jgi:hypothetical protein